jgi:outer membrane protein assembly factor BamB
LNASPTRFTQNISSLILPYHINIIDGIIYVTDAKNYTTSGQVFAFSTSGSLLYSFQTSVNPSKIIKIQ